MLQYILTESDRYSAAELAQMAVEGGCTWISLNLPGLSDEDMRQAVVADGIMDMCRTEGVFLTVDDRPALARELGLHGVRLSRRFFADNQDMTPAAMRAELGPEAVIGIECADPSAVPALAAPDADIDFVSVPATFDSAARRAFVEAVHAAGCTIPLVAQGDFASDDVAAVMAEGFNGLAVGAPITDAADPVAATGAILTALAQATGKPN